MELERHYLSEAIFKVFAGYICKSFYISKDFQVSERLCRGPEFSHNYTIGYIINRKKVNCYWGCTLASECTMVIDEQIEQKKKKLKLSLIKFFNFTSLLSYGQICSCQNRKSHTILQSRWPDIQCIPNYTKNMCGFTSCLAQL